MTNKKKNVGAKLKSRGASFRVWAPFAENVALVGSFSEWQPIGMANELDGYWFVEVPHVQAGQEYKFQITYNGKTFQRNDPRALHLTTSSGNSVVSDTSFDWEDDNFTPPPIEQQILYELHVGTFNRSDPAEPGTFDDVMSKLDHLAGLGVNMIELLPISAMLQDRGWGYAPDYIYAVESLYGGRRKFQQFVKAAHQRGIGVILDVVYNHFGPDKSLDLWQFDGWHEEGHGGIYFYNDWRAITPWGNTRPDFGRPEVRQYILDNVAMWMHECRIDGLRVDSTIYMRNVNGYNNNPDNDLPEAWGLLQQINKIARKINPKALMIGEDVADNEYITKPADQGGAGFKAQWELNFPFALRDALNKDYINLTGIIGLLGRKFNNDPFGRIIFSDSHDSAANGRSRINEDVSPGRATTLPARRKMLLAQTVLLTSPGIPMLFQGQEFMEDGAFNDWRALDWAKSGKFSGITLANKHLIDLRKNTHKHTGGLLGGNLNLSHVDDVNKVIAYHRWDKGGPKDDVMVIVNFGGTTHHDYMLGFPRNGTWTIRFNSNWSGYNPDVKDEKAADLTVENGTGSIVLPKYSAIIFSQDK